MNDPYSKNPAKDAKDQELAQYIADMLLELRKMAKAAGLKTLLGLLEISFCEAFSIANKVEIPLAKLKSSGVWQGKLARRDLANCQFQRGREGKKISYTKTKTGVWL